MVKNQNEIIEVKKKKGKIGQFCNIKYKIEMQLIIIGKNISQPHMNIYI